MLLRYELQKVFDKRANQIILLLLVLLVAPAELPCDKWSG